MQFLLFINFAAAIQGLFLSYLVVHNNSRDTKSLVLGMLTFVLSVSILGGVYGMSGYYKKIPHLVNIADPLFLLYGPLLYFYIFVLTHNRIPRQYFLHGIPFIIYIIAFIPLYIKTGEEKIEFAEYIFLNDEIPLKALLMQLARVSYLAIYVVISLMLVKSYQKKIKGNFSNIEKISLSNAKNILSLFLIVLVIAVATFLLGYFLPFNFSLSNNIIGFFVGVIIYSLAYSTWNKKSINKSELPDNIDSPDELKKYINAEKTKGRSNFVLSDEQYERFSKQLEEAMEDEKLFTENDISLTELSKNLNIQPYQLSELISRISGESFFDFINKYRIEEIKSRLTDPKYNSLSILGIAMDCGFNSKSSFNTAFKKFTGYTPSEFRKLEPA